MRRTILSSFLFLFATGLPWTSRADEFDFQTYFKEKANAYFKEAVEVRRHLHQYPELCLEERKTAAYVARYLENLGLEVETGIAGTGVKAVLRGNRKKPVIGIRADMDALPMEEKTGLGFQSEHPGVMHACGHDAHMTNVLLSAKMLSEVKEKIPGTIVFIFQPCEEGTKDGSPSGAHRMIDAGVLKDPKIDAMLGLHVMPGAKPGTVALREGPIMASVATVFITIKGKSSHGALPHQGIDAIYAASLAINQFQSLISRARDPNERVVFTIGKIEGGDRFNIVADRVRMEGTVRTFSTEAEDKIEKGIEKILQGLRKSMGITYELEFKRVTRYVKNDEKLTRRITRLFEKLLGNENVTITQPLTVGEDFSAYSQRMPSVFYFLGAGEKGTIHHPKFSVDEQILRYGPFLFSAAAIDLLKAGL